MVAGDVSSMSSFDPAKSKSSPDESAASADEFESAFEAMMAKDGNTAAKPSPASESDEIFDVDEISQIFSSETSSADEMDDVPEFGPGFDESAFAAKFAESKAQVLPFAKENNAGGGNDEFAELAEAVEQEFEDIDAALEALEGLEISSDELLTADAITNPFIEEGTVNEEDYNECLVADADKQPHDSDFDVNYFIEESFKDFELRPSYFYNFAKRFKTTYLLLNTAVAMIGFVYFALFPVAMVLVSFNGFELLDSPLTRSTSTLMGMLLAFTLLIFMMAWKLMDLEFAEPQGLILDEENAGKLFEAIEAYKQEFRIPTIHKVVLTRRHELSVVKLPRFGIPLWSKNVLAIGYPLLQTLPREYFECALKRRLLQYSKRSNIWINWLSVLRNTWVLYATSLKKRRHFLDLLHYCFFGPYSALYRNLSVYVTQRDELFADGKALHHCNDRDLIKTAATIRITKAMLVQYYWPKLKKNMKEDLLPPAQLKPYENMPAILQQLLSDDKAATWFIRLAREKRKEKTPDPAFTERMARMGYTKIISPETFEESAAQYFFGEEHEDITTFMDELWALQVDKEVFLQNISNNTLGIKLPAHASLPSSS